MIIPECSVIIVNMSWETFDQLSHELFYFIFFYQFVPYTCDLDPAGVVAMNR